MQVTSRPLTDELGPLLLSGKRHSLAPLWATAAVILPLFWAVRAESLLVRMFALTLALGGVALVIFLLRTSPVTYDARREGLDVRPGIGVPPLLGEPVQVYRWDEIESILRRIVELHNRKGDLETLGVTYRYQIAASHGRQLVLDQAFEQIGTLGEIVTREVNRCLLPATLAQYDRGEPVRFGPIRASTAGLMLGGMEVHWSAEPALTVRAGVMSIAWQGAKQPWRSPLADIPNVDLFLELLARRQDQLAVEAFPDQFGESVRRESGTSLADVLDTDHRTSW